MTKQNYIDQLQVAKEVFENSLKGDYFLHNEFDLYLTTDLKWKSIFDLESDDRIDFTSAEINNLPNNIINMVMIENTSFINVFISNVLKTIININAE